jgi:hypothetical protein
VSSCSVRKVSARKGVASIVGARDVPSEAVVSRLFAHASGSEVAQELLQYADLVVEVAF